MNHNQGNEGIHRQTFLHSSASPPGRGFYFSVKAMIEVDLGESQDGPTLWIVVNEPQDFPRRRRVFHDLSRGERDSIDVLSTPETFRASIRVRGLVFATIPGTDKSRLDINQEHSRHSLTWRQNRIDWDTALQKIDTMNPNNHRAGHQYFRLSKPHNRRFSWRGLEQNCPWQGSSFGRRSKTDD